MGKDPGRSDPVALALDRVFGPGEFTMHDFTNPGVIMKGNIAQNFLNQVKGVIKIVRKGLDLKPEDRFDGFGIPLPGIGGKGMAETSCADVEPGGKVAVINIPGSDFRGNRPEQVEIYQHIGRKRGAVKTDINIGDAIGFQFTFDKQRFCGGLGSGLNKIRGGIKIIKGK